MRRTFSLATKEEWKCRADGTATFKMPTMQHKTLWNEDVLCKEYRPKMLLYALNELFFIFHQVKRQRGVDERLIMAYKILCLMALQCTERQHGSEKHGMPDALSLLNINDTCHLKRLMWMVYDGALLVGRQPKLPGDRQWCTILASTYRHIYRGCDDAAHCPPYTLASWDCQERTEALCQEGKLGAGRSGHKRASRSRRRSRSSSRSSSRHHSRMLGLRDWSGHSCCSPPNMWQALPRHRKHGHEDITLNFCFCYKTHGRCNSR